MIKDESGLSSDIDGIFGLARDHPYFLSEDKSVLRGPSYMKALQKAELISENTFSFNMVPFGDDADSAIDFGKPRKSRMRDSDELVWIELQEDFFWSSYCQGFAIGELSNSWAWGSIKDNDETLKDNTIYSLFDTGASQIIVPQNYFSDFLEQVYSGMADNEYELKNDIVVTKCYEDFPPIHFLYEEHWVSVYPDQYVIDLNGD